MGFNFDIDNTSSDKESIKKYFRELRTRLIIWLLAGFVVPYCALYAYFHLQYDYTLKKTSKLNLTVLAESQRNTVDLFLQERVVNLFNLFHCCEFRIFPSQEDMDAHLQNLRHVNSAFVDVGFLSSDGIHIGYAGPFPYLQDQDYSGENWFKTLMGQERNYYISNISTGFRDKLHFTIAIRMMIDNQFFIMRSTMGTDTFNPFMKSAEHGREVECSLINKEGLYQFVSPHRGTLLEMSDYVPEKTTGTGVDLVKKNGGATLVAYTWLTETPWALIVRQPLSIVHSGMEKARTIIISSFIIIIIIFVGLICFFTTWITAKIQAIVEKKNELLFQLQHSSKLASIGKLTAEVAHEINNPLSIITSTSGVIRDMLDPEIDMDFSGPKSIIAELETIDKAAFRAKNSTMYLLEIGHKHAPQLTLCNVNDILEEIMIGLKERQFQLDNIKVCRNYAPDIPEIMVDHDLITQVLLNLMNNAGDSIPGPGTITLATKHDDEYVHISITDTGAGMDSKQLKEIFNPFYTTKEKGKGTGLGLSLSVDILNAMNGKIDAQSIKGTGSSFTVSLPIIRKGEENEGKQH